MSDGTDKVKAMGSTVPPETTTPQSSSRSWLRHFTLIAQRGRQRLTAATTPSGRALGRTSCARLLEQKGEASSLVLAADILAQVASSSEPDIERLLTMLAAEFGPNRDAVTTAATAWLAAPNPATLANLGSAVEPPRQELFRRLNMVPGGTSALVELRGALLSMLPRREDLTPVDTDLKHLFASWFNRGFLRLEQITWETSADILERLTSYEAVHEMRGWKDLRGRLAADRRCFAFFHPALPREPLIFVEVALTEGIASSIDPLISVDREVIDPHLADSAMFYSISNGHTGLRGISFGSFLIKQVMDQLARELPNIRHFATISPMRRFADALQPDGSRDRFTHEELKRLSGRDVNELERCIGSGATLPSSLDGPVTLLALAYLTRLGDGQRSVDSVAHFHLSNGARIERINMRADIGEQARGSLGVMVNYLYEPRELEANHERYVERGEIALGQMLSKTRARIDTA